MLEWDNSKMGKGVKGGTAAVCLTRDQNKVMTTTRCARSVRKREGTSPEIRPMTCGDRGTASEAGSLKRITPEVSASEQNLRLRLLTARSSSAQLSG